MPSLLTQRSSGLLETHVHWDDILPVLQENLNTSAIFGPNKKVTNVGKDKGFMSMVALIEPDWIGLECDRLPQKMIVKICSTFSMLNPSDYEDEDNLMKIHNAEVKFYQLIHKYSRDGLFCKIYGYKKFTDDNKMKGFILMEYIEDIVDLDLTKKLSLDECRDVLKSLATLNATSLKFTEEEQATFPKKMYSEVMIGAFSDKIISKNFAHLLSLCDTNHHQSIRRLEACSQQVVGKQKMEEYDNMTDILNMKPVVSHGDLWNMNLLFNKHDGEYKVKAIIDFQECWMGTSGQDLVQIFNCFLSPQDRRNNWKSLLLNYFSYLQQLVPDEDMPFSFDQLVECYERFIPFGAFFLLPYIEYLVEMKDKTDKDEEIQRRFIDDMIFLVEDALEGMKREKKSFN